MKNKMSSLGLIEERNKWEKDNETNVHALEVLKETEYAHKVIKMGVEQSIVNIYESDDIELINFWVT